MRTEKLIEQLELYSNAAVGFIVAQSLTFSFTFGNNAAFGCEITRYKWLAAGLLAHFVLSSVLAVGAVRYIGHRIVALSEEHHAILRTVFSAKCWLVALFAVIPVGLLASFGLLADPAQGRCKALNTSTAATASPAQGPAAVNRPAP